MKVQHSAQVFSEEPVKVDTFKSFNAQKKSYEKFWKVIYIGVSILSAILLKKVFMFQTMPEFQNIKQGTFLDILTITFPFALVFTLFDLGVHYLFDDFFLKYVLTEERYEGPARKKRAYTLVKWSYSIVYYAISSVTAYMILKDTSFFPHWLGGSGSSSNLYLNAPNIPEVTFLMKIFYLLQFGKHFSRLFSHMFIRSEGNYYQYVLHHALSNFLIFFSYLTNMWLIGIMVLLCHDLSDSFLISARTFKDVKFCWNPLLKGLYVLAFLGWVFCRLIVFPICCVYPSITTFNSVARQYLDEVGVSVMQIPYYSMGIMMSVLLVLQIFWTYYILQSFMSVNVTAKVSHNYD